MKCAIKYCLLASLLLLAIWSRAFAIEVRAKDIVRFSGERHEELLGYGLVVGLNGTGDGRATAFTAQSMANMLKNMGITVNPSEFRTRNVAAVMVSARITPAAEEGCKLDCTVSSIGDAKSLQGGVLLHTALHAADGMMHAIAQGPVSIGGYNYSSGSNVTVQKNHSTTGLVQGGAEVKNRIPGRNPMKESVSLTLLEPDFTTATRLAEAINGSLGDRIAIPVNEATVNLAVPDSVIESNQMVAFVSKIENLKIAVDTKARVVINERTGTIAAGTHVSIAAAAISHGNLHLEITNTKAVSQPAPLSIRGETVVMDQSRASVEEDGTRFIYLPESTDVGELAQALNLIGVTPRDLISIFQALKRTGALNAELIIM